MIEPVIVVPAHNRSRSLSRLLRSLADADYQRPARLFISLEGGASDDVKRVARDFGSPMLHVEVIEHEERLGLRKHILACGDFSLQFGAVVVLEDDLFVDRYFYRYAVAALRHYAGEPAIAGIALYAPEYNEYAGLPFRPMRNGYSTYCMQVPCSWGQCWTAEQWQQFRNWYAVGRQAAVRDTIGLPCVVKSWPESSWKKYFAAYLVHANRFFVYPYLAYSTNCSDPGGTHIKSGSAIHQVSLASQARPKPQLSFCPSVEPDVAYDAFMEPCGEGLHRQLGLGKEEVEIDCLGTKPLQLLRRKPLALTCRPVGESIQEYPRSFRPIEQNVFHPVEVADGSVLSLAESARVTNRYRRAISEYSYFAGFNLSSRSVLGEGLRAVPKMLYKRIQRWRGSWSS